MGSLLALFKGEAWRQLLGGDVELLAGSWDAMTPAIRASESCGGVLRTAELEARSGMGHSGPASLAMHIYRPSRRHRSVPSLQPPLLLQGAMPGEQVSALTAGDTVSNPASQLD